MYFGKIILAKGSIDETNCSKNTDITYGLLNLHEYFSKKRNPFNNLTPCNNLLHYPFNFIDLVDLFPIGCVLRWFNERNSHHPVISPLLNWLNSHIAWIKYCGYIIRDSR